METQLWDGVEWGWVREGKGKLAQPSKGRGPVSVPKGGLTQQGHPVPLREGGELAPLGHPVLSSILAKSERENERRTRRARSQPSPKIPRLALTPQLQPQGEWGGPRARGHRGPVGPVGGVYWGGSQEMWETGSQGVQGRTWEQAGSASLPL